MLVSWGHECVMLRTYILTQGHQGPSLEPGGHWAGRDCGDNKLVAIWISRSSQQIKNLTGYHKLLWRTCIFLFVTAPSSQCDESAWAFADQWFTWCWTKKWEERSRVQRRNADKVLLWQCALRQSQGAWAQPDPADSVQGVCGHR